MIPILRRHDHKAVVGTVRSDAGKLVIEFANGVEVTREQCFETFGNCGLVIIESEAQGEAVLIRKAEILEFSI